MLADYAPVPTIAVADLARAREFYEGTLGFAPDDASDGVLYRSGSGHFLVYPSAHAGTNRATAMSFQVPGADFDPLVADLRGRGVEFDTFDLPPGASWVDGVADFGGGARGVWFTDPDGNILNADTMPA